MIPRARTVRSSWLGMFGKYPSKIPVPNYIREWIMVSLNDGVMSLTTHGPNVTWIPTEIATAEQWKHNIPLSFHENTSWFVEIPLSGILLKNSQQKWSGKQASNPPIPIINQRRFVDHTAHTVHLRLDPQLVACPRLLTRNLPFRCGKKWLRH